MWIFQRIRATSDLKAFCLLWFKHCRADGKIAFFWPDFNLNSGSHILDRKLIFHRLLHGAHTGTLMRVSARAHTMFPGEDTWGPHRGKLQLPDSPKLSGALASISHSLCNWSGWSLAIPGSTNTTVFTLWRLSAVVSDTRTIDLILLRHKCEWNSPRWRLARTGKGPQVTPAICLRSKVWVPNSHTHKC